MGYCSFWASWFHMNLYPWKGSGHSGALFKYKRQLCTYTHTYTRSQKDIHIQTIHALHTYIQPAKRKWCFLISSNTRNLSLSYSSTNQNHNMHARTRSNTHIFTRQSALFFSLSDTHSHYFSCIWSQKCTQTHAPDKHIQNHNGPNPGRWCTLCLISLLVERKQGGLGQAGLKICCMQLWPPLWKLVFYVPTVLFWTATALWQGQSHCYHCNTL